MPVSKPFSLVCNDKFKGYKFAKGCFVQNLFTQVRTFSCELFHSCHRNSSQEHVPPCEKMLFSTL